MQPNGAAPPFHARQVAGQAIKAVLVIPLLVLLALLSGCALLDRGADLTSRAFAEMSGRDTTPVGDPLYLQLQLALLSDTAVTQILQKTETPLEAVDDLNRRAALLGIRLDYAAAMWNAASGPSPYANAIDMLLTLTVGRRQLERSPLAHALGESLRPTLAVLRSAQGDVERLVRNFLTPAEFSALDQAIQEAEESHVLGQRPGIVDLQHLLASSRVAKSGGGGAFTNLFGILGLNPFAGLDPATREIAESRQFGERLLFTVQRMPVLLRLNAELLATQVAADLDLDRAQASLDRATTAMQRVAQTTAQLPDRLSAERAQLVADMRAEAERLGTLAHDYRGLFDAATTTAGTANQALLTFAGMMQRLESEKSEPSVPSRPFDVTEYAETAHRIGEASVHLSELLSNVHETLDAPGLTRLTPEVEALLVGAEERVQRWLYTAFALACGLIVCVGIAVILTVWVLRSLRGQPALRTDSA